MMAESSCVCFSVSLNRLHVPQGEEPRYSSISIVPEVAQNNPSINGSCVGCQRVGRDLVTKQQQQQT